MRREGMNILNARQDDGMLGRANRRDPVGQVRVSRESIGRNHAESAYGLCKKQENAFALVRYSICRQKRRLRDVYYINYEKNIKYREILRINELA